MLSVYVKKFKISLYSVFFSELNRYSRWLYKTRSKLNCNDKLSVIVYFPETLVSITEKFYNRFIIELWWTFFGSQLKKKIFEKVFHEKTTHNMNKYANIYVVASKINVHLHIYIYIYFRLCIRIKIFNTN